MVFAVVLLEGQLRQAGYVLYSVTQGAMTTEHLFHRIHNNPYIEPFGTNPHRRRGQFPNVELGAGIKALHYSLYSQSIYLCCHIYNEKPFFFGSIIMFWSEDEMENDLFSLELLGNVLLFFLVFGMSATVTTESIKSQLKNQKAILTGIVLQFLILPILGFVTVKLLDLDETMGITLLVVTSSPGGSYSNWWCSMFNADLALSVTMTTISTLLSIVMLPVNLLLYANHAYEADVVAALDWEA